MLIAGVIGWLMGKVKIPTSPAIPGQLVPSGPDRIHPLWRDPRTVKEKSGIAVKKKYIKIQGTLTGFGINFQRSGCLFGENLQKL